MQTIALRMAALLILAAPPLAAPASAMPALSVSPSARTDVITVSDHHCDHAHSGHRGNHGNDRYYDDNSNMGVLFKSFVTGTLFARTYNEEDNRDAPPPKRY